MGTGVLPGQQSGQTVKMNTHLDLQPKIRKKEWGYTSYMQITGRFGDVNRGRFSSSLFYNFWRLDVHI